MQRTTENQTLRQKVRTFYQGVNYPRADMYRMDKSQGTFNISGTAPFTDRNMKILVVGCGTCEAPAVANANPESLVTGIDFSHNSLAIAKSIKRAKGFDNLKLVHMDLLDSQFKSEFGWASLNGVLHHIPEANIAVQKIAEALIDGGVVMGMVYSDKRPAIIRELNQEFTSSMMTVDEVLEYFYKQPGGNDFFNRHDKHKIELADTWLHPYFVEYSPDSLKALFLENGFKECIPWYEPRDNAKLMFVARKGKDFKRNGNEIIIPLDEIELS